ncbi:MAG: CBS domain-containing protein [Alphaproteobacteria bacterium]|nr:CBS domain-containing protein [Alphaproteobacteria bacterium]
MLIDTAPLSKLDSFPYRHRVAEVMNRPLLTGPASLSLGEACQRIAKARVSALVVVDGEDRPIGVMTERDLVNAIAHRGKAALDLIVHDVMSRPVQTVADKDFVHVALGRMSRLGVRHLVAVDCEGKAIGMVTGRALLQLRSRETILLADGVATAQNAFDLYRVKMALPELARHLLAEGLGMLEIAAVMSSTLKGIVARASELAVQSLADDGWGQAPVKFCLLALGSVGRGESLLGGDQDTALIFDGGPEHDAWFAEFGKRVSRLLADSGIPYCQGKVMASEAFWRRPLADWKIEISRWVDKAMPETMLNVDIFFDFAPAFGDVTLAASLKAHALATAGASPFFLRMLANEVERAEPPLGVLGGFDLEDGRLAVKLHGLLPIVNAARVMSLKAGVDANGTAARLAGLASLGKIEESDAAETRDIYELFLSVLLDQQLFDLSEGRPASSKIDPTRFKRSQLNRLKTGFKHLKLTKSMIAHLLGH